MFSVVRRAISRPKIAFRPLSTLVADAPAVSPASASQLTNVLGNTSAGNVDIPSSSKITAATVANPVYLSMSRLIPPAENEVDLEDELVELDPFVFNHPVRRDILHLCVVHHLDGLRQGSANTKTRGEVRGSGAKIRPQKGTGRARLGDGQSPMLRGGGIAFGPKPRDFSTNLPRKVIQMGMRVALSSRVKEHSLGVVKSLEWSGHKTKDFASRLEELGWSRTLFVTGAEVPKSLKRVTGNLQKIESKTAKDLTVYDAVKYSRLIMDLQAVEWFEHALGRSTSSTFKAS
ncbi:hypothetical protein QCA50_001934 [Cerrena zonata]|uniref:Large ribosomal subunit protein uL4m n=1 Tax=Cerrena zonata TaxID=2478898 RepID=A0AAW0GMS2_9APHY